MSGSNRFPGTLGVHADWSCKRAVVAVTARKRQGDHGPDSSVQAAQTGQVLAEGDRSRTGWTKDMMTFGSSAGSTAAAGLMAQFAGPVCNFLIDCDQTS